LISLQIKLIKIGTRVVRHARAVTFQLAEVAVTGPMVQGYPFCHSPIAGAAVMCMTLKLPESERKRQDKSVRRAKKIWAPDQDVAHSPSKPTAFCRSGGGGHHTGHTDHLTSRRNQTNLPSSGRPHWECRLIFKKGLLWDVKTAE
jgi:hypothetical protein